MFLSNGHNVLSLYHAKVDLSSFMSGIVSYAHAKNSQILYIVLIYLIMYGRIEARNLSVDVEFCLIRMEYRYAKYSFAVCKYCA